MKKMMKSFYGNVFSVTALAVILALAACAPVTGPDTSGIPAGKGWVTVRIDSAARTLVPGSVITNVFTSYDLTFTPSAGTPVGLTGITNLTGIELDPGTYSLTLKAYTGDGETKKEAAYGTVEGIKVIEKESTDVQVALFFNPGAGDGTLSFTVTRPEGLDLTGAWFAVEPLYENGTSYGEKWLDALYIGYDGKPIPLSHSSDESVGSGYYTVTVTLTAGDFEAVKYDVVHIGAGQTTVLDWTFTQADFAGTASLKAPANVAFSAEGVVTWDAPADETGIKEYSIQIWKALEFGNDIPVEHPPVTVLKGGAVDGAYSYGVVAALLALDPEALQKLGPGDYGVTVQAIAVEGSDYDDSAVAGLDSPAAWQKVIKRTSVEYAWWFETSKARWVNVDGDSNYVVQLYKDGKPLGEPVEADRENTQNPEGSPGETITTYDFTSAITTYGSYTFGVVTKGAGYLILDGDEKKSLSYEYVNPAWEKLPSVQGLALSSQGVATWDAPADETNVASYSIQIWKGGTTNTPVGDRITVTKGTGKTGTTYTYDLLSVLQGLAPDHYGISIMAIAGGEGYRNSDDTDDEADGVWQEVKKFDVQYVWWAAADPTVAHWEMAAGAGNVSDYIVNLYKDDGKVEGDIPGGKKYTDGQDNKVKFYIDLTALITAHGSGSYTFGVAAKGNGYLILDGDEKIVDAAYADKRLSAPANPRWTGDTAEWNAVAGAAGYTVQLYKNETPAGAAVEVSQTSYAFTLTDPGVYTFTVTAKGDGVDSEDSTPADSAKAGDPGKRAIGNTASVTLIPADESGNLTVTPTGTSISKTGGTTSVELKVSPGAGFTDFTWVVDGKSVTGTESGYTLSEDDKTLTIDAAALKLGGHSVTVYAKKDGVPWSPADAVRITVTK